MPTIRRLVAGTLTALVLAPALASAQAPKAGVVTTLEGNVTATRATAPAVPLKFKDDVFLQDRITTAELSLARMLLGGKAVVTVRERTALTITEVPGRSTIDIDSGKFALVVAREKMRPGEVIEIRTPNAIAGVRGSVVVTEVESAPGAPTVVSSLYVLRGDMEAQPRDPTTRAPTGTPRTINVMEQFRVVGLLGSVSAIRPDQLGPIRAGLQPKSKPHSQAQNQDQVTEQQMQTAAALAGTLSSPGATSEVLTPTATPAPPTAAEPTVAVAPIIPPVIEQKTALEVAGVLSTAGVSTLGSQLTNPGFETGDFTSWTLSGAGNVISQFGTASIKPPEGKFMALIHTKTGTTTSGCSSGKECTATLLTQKFNVTSSVTVKFQLAVLSNEFPTFTSTKSIFNDEFSIEVLDSAGKELEIFKSTVNDTAFTATSESVTVGTFTLSSGGGQSAFQERKKTIVPAKGEAEFSFKVENISDTNNDTALLVDAVVLTQDPPLVFITDGSFVPGGTSPLLSVANGSQTFDSLLMVCCGGSATLGGPALKATNSSLEVPFSLVSAIQGGTITSSWPGAMVELQGGSYTLGAAMGVFEVSGLSPGDQPLRHGGTFLDATDATVRAGAAMIVDTALLAATAPLLNLKNSTFISNDPALDMYRANVTSLGPLFTLNASNLAVNNGALVNLVNGSILNVNGNLVQLSNGSTLSLLNGPVAKVGGSSILNVSGALVSFSGAGNSVSISNSLCSSFSCANVGGLNVALTGGASTANVSIANPVKGSGAITSSPNAAAILISGSGSKVTIGGN